MQLSRRGMGTSLAFVVAVVILVAGAACVAALSTTAQTTTRTTAASTGSSTVSSSGGQATSVETSTNVVSQYGLELGLYVNGAQFTYGQNIQVNVSEFNTLDQTDSVNSSGDWFVPVALGSCTNLNDLPMGIALYQGHYNANDVSAGTEIQIFPATVCPMTVRYISGYQFQAESDLATILPGSAPTPMTASVDLVNGTSVATGQSSLLNPGQYTLVAADEWGAVAFLYFQVQGIP